MTPPSSSQNNTSLYLANDSPKKRGLRLRRLRNLANLSRELMCEGGGANRHTLIGWENGRFGGLTAKGAEKIVARVRQEGVHCTVEWLMEGTGLEPSINSPLPSSGGELFHGEGEDVISFVVDDDGMAPLYQEGDRVAGKKKTGKDIEQAIGFDCIVETENGEILLRNVRKGEHQSTYILVCNNPFIKKRNSVLINVKLNYAAPVVWIRKKDFAI